MGRPHVNDETRWKLIFDLNKWANRPPLSTFRITMSKNNAKIKQSRTCSKKLEEMINTGKNDENFAHWRELQQKYRNVDHSRTVQQCAINCHRDDLEALDLEVQYNADFENKWLTNSDRQKQVEETYTRDLIEIIDQAAAVWLPESFTDVYNPLITEYNLK